MTVHQACVLVRGIVITLRHSSKSVTFRTSGEKTRFPRQFHCVLTLALSTRLAFLPSGRVYIREEKEKCGLNESFDSILPFSCEISLRRHNHLQHLSPSVARVIHNDSLATTIFSEKCSGVCSFYLCATFTLFLSTEV